MTRLFAFQVTVLPTVLFPSSFIKAGLAGV